MIALLTQIMEESHHDSNSELPTTVKEALECDEGKDWEDAINTELKEIETWKLEDLPEGRQPIGCKWVFVKKKDNMGKILKYKARLVAQEFSQKLGTDYSNDGTFAPVMQFDTLRTMLGLSAIHGWNIRQLDMKGAYLNGKLERRNLHEAT